MADVSTTAQRAEGSAGPAFGEFRPGAILMSLHILAGAFFFAYGLEALFFAWQTPEYSHGPVIPLLSLYMFLREMKSVPPVAGTVSDRGPGIAVVVLALAVGLLGLLVRIPDIVTYGMIVWVFGTILTTFGLRRGWYFWPSVLHLVFMLPLPQFIYWPVSIWLQMVSSRIGVDIISFFGIPVYLDGNVIDLGVYRLQVAEACSGLRYLFPVMSFSYVFGVLYTGPVWHKLVLIASAAPITVLMNSVRIGIIGVMVDNFGIEHAEGFLHAFEGWVIFIACILILFGLAALMQRLQPDPKPLGESIDLDFDGIGTQVRRYVSIPVTRPLIAATAFSVVAAIGWGLAPERETVRPERAPLSQFPMQIDGWRGTERALPREIVRVLGADDTLTAAYVPAGGGPVVDLYIAYYHKLTEGSGIHSPEVCIPAGGWEVTRWREETRTVGDGRQVTLNRALITKGSERQLVYYWFEQRGRQITGDYAAKFYNIYDSLTRGRTDGALVRFMTPVRSGESEAGAAARLDALLGAAMPLLPEYLPE